MRRGEGFGTSLGLYNHMGQCEYYYLCVVFLLPHGLASVHLLVCSPNQRGKPPGRSLRTHSGLPTPHALPSPLVAGLA